MEQGIALTSSTVADAVTDVLRVAILNHEFQPGQRLLQAELASRLGVSRQPVRDALQRLVVEGLLTTVPGGGFTLRSYTEPEIQENYRLRVILEGEAARLAAVRAEPDSVQALRRVHARGATALAADDLGAFITVNAEFHESIRRLAGSPQLRQFIDQLWIGYTVVTPIFVGGRAQRSHQEHEAILEAVAAGDDSRSAALMRAHIESGLHDYERHRTSSMPVDQAPSDGA